MDAIPPTLPFHLARAYGVKPAAPAAKPTPTVTVTPVGVRPGGVRVNGVRTGDAVDLASAKKAEAIREKLVAATVPGGVVFGDDGARAAAPVSREASIPFYRHPADKNAAATAIGLGGRLDLEG